MARLLPAGRVVASTLATWVRGVTPAKAVAAFGIGLREVAVFQPDAHVGHARLVTIAQAVGVAVGEHGAEDVALVAEDAGLDLHLGGGHGAGEDQGRGAGGVGAVDAVALQRAGADAHAVAQHAVRTARHLAHIDHQLRAAVGELAVERRVIQAHRARHIAEAGRQVVDDGHAGEGLVGGIEHAHGVIQHVADFDHGARGGLGQVQGARDRIERDVDGDHAEGGADGELAAERAVQVGLAVARQLARGGLGRETVVVRRGDLQAVQARGDQREVVHAVGVGDDGARHPGDGVDVEHDRRGARVAAVAFAGHVDQGYGGAGDRLVADAVVDDADRVDQDVGRDRAVAAAGDAGGEGVVGHDFEHAVAHVVLMAVRVLRAVHGHGGDAEQTAVGRGFAGHECLAVAGLLRGYGNADVFGPGRVGVAVGRRDLHEQLAVGAGGAGHGREGGRGEIGDGIGALRAHRVRFDGASAAARLGEGGAGLVDDGGSRVPAQQQGSDQAEEDEVSELSDHGAGVGKEFEKRRPGTPRLLVEGRLTG